MLLNLHIENVAIISKSDIDFYGGFNVLTGETGAGKSIIIDSINLLLGNKGSRELISTGKDYAFVSATFFGFNSLQKDLLKSFDVIPDEEGNIVISRKITKDGRSVSKINGQNVTVSVLKSISLVLVNIFGQHDGTKILDPDTHIEYLDSYCKNKDLIDEYGGEYDLYDLAKSDQATIKQENSESVMLHLGIDVLNFIEDIYDVLHTLSDEIIVSDINEYINNR